MINSTVEHIYPATLLCDFYKVSHRAQYPDKTEYVYSTWTPRATRIPEIAHVVAFGFQAFVRKFLIEYFKEHFFSRTEDEVVAEYCRVIQYCLGVSNPDYTHIRDLHRLGFLPLHVKAVKEGTLVPLRVPMLTVENTDPRFFWLTNYIETLMSAELWAPATAATIANQYRTILNRWAGQTDDDTSFVQFQGHDFSMRGLEGVEACTLIGAGHLLSFVGTDTIPAILSLERYYGANIENELVGCSVPATEHSVMSAGGMETELQTFERLITKVYPSGIVSIVSDTWDLWKVVGEIVPSLKGQIMQRDGKVVIRPDSGDPVKIICGDENAENPLARKGVIEVLWDTFGGTVTAKGHKKLDPHIGAIYGDSITLDRAERICAGLAAKGFASTNIVFGIGSYTYQYTTRDTFGFAMKATSVTINGQEYPIFKDPVTDDGTKRSQRGRVRVVRDDAGNLTCQDGLISSQVAWYEAHGDGGLLETIFLNGQLRRFETLREIRERLQTKEQ